MVTKGGRNVWVAGILAPTDEDGNSLANDFAGQVRCVFRKMARQLEEAGANLDDVVTVKALNNPDARVEITAVAVAASV